MPPPAVIVCRFRADPLQDLTAAVDSWDQRLLEAVLEKCDKPEFAGAPYDSPMVDECRDALKKVQ